MKTTLTTIIGLLAFCLSTLADRPLNLNNPTLTTSCTSCDSSFLNENWGGTWVFVITINGTGYDPKLPIRLTFHRDDGQEFISEFNVGSYFQNSWANLPVGNYILTSSQRLSKSNYKDILSVPIVIY